MDPKVIFQLDQLTNELYAKNATEFSESREFYWEGWKKLLPILKKKFRRKKPQQVLDVGCGNARFANFLADNFPLDKIVYTGLDNSSLLLQIAAHSLPENLPKAFINSDLVLTLHNDQRSYFSKKKYDVIVLFGLLHHIPSEKLRLKLLEWSAELLQPKGLLIYSCWQFLDFERFHKKIVSPEAIGISPTDLEANDYILDWKRGEERYRYCHYLDKKEQEKIQKHLLKKFDGLTLIKTFSADAKEQSGNDYYIFRRD